MKGSLLIRKWSAVECKVDACEVLVMLTLTSVNIRLMIRNTESIASRLQLYKNCQQEKRLIFAKQIFI